MKFAKQRIQRGSLRLLPRANNKMAWECRYRDPATGGPDSMYFSLDEFPTKYEMQTHLLAFTLKLNPRNPTQIVLEPTVGTVLDRYILDENLLEIKKRRPGDRTNGREELSYTTALSYLSIIKRIREKWGEAIFADITPLEFQNWLKQELVGAPKTKGHVKAFLHRLYQKAKLWGMFDFEENPIDLVEVRGISKVQKKAVTLTIEQYYLILRLLPEPYRTMVIVAQCTGLRVEEVLPLEWDDIDFENLSMMVVRAVVHGRVQLVETDYSEDALPLDPDFATVLLNLKRISGQSELLFPSPVTRRCFHASPIQQDYIRRAGWCLVKCPVCEAAPGVACVGESKKSIPVHADRREAAVKAKLGSVGWHTFRHTYRSLLDDTGAPVGCSKNSCVTPTSGRP